MTRHRKPVSVYVAEQILFEFSAERRALLAYASVVTDYSRASLIACDDVQLRYLIHRATRSVN